MNEVFLAGTMLGLAMGVLTTFPLSVAWLHRMRRKDEESNLVAHNILRGYGTAAYEAISTGKHAVRDPIYVEDNWLTDDLGALAQAKAAAATIMPYPGDTGKLDEPDEAWLLWLAEDGRGKDYWAGRSGNQDVLNPRPVTAWVVWHHTEQALAWLLVLALRPLDAWEALTQRLTSRPSRYPWWQKVADRVWEWSAVSEWNAIRINRAVTAGLERWFEAIIWGLALLGGASPDRPVQRQPIRPKRYYPIKQG